MIKKSENSKLGGGCLILFFLPFALVGLFASSKFFQHFSESWEAQSWPKVQANSVKARAGERSSGEGTTHYIKGSFRYQFEGESFSSEKITITQSGGFGIEVVKMLIVSVFFSLCNFLCYISVRV